MKTLIVAATIFEVKPLLTHFNLAEGNFSGNDKFDVLITGVGMTATAYTMGRHLANAKYELVINLGIAGSFDKSIPLGTVVNVIEDTFAELGAEDNERFLSIDELNLGKSRYNAVNNLSEEITESLKKVDGITVNKVHGNESSIAGIGLRSSATIESMEGAAVLYCCEHTGIPCLQIRSISNYVEPRNKNAWQIGLAITNLNAWAIGFLTKA